MALCWVHSCWRWILAATLVALLALAPALQGHAAELHMDAVSTGVETEAPHAHPCPEDGHVDHGQQPSCTPCVLHCMGGVHAFAFNPDIPSDLTLSAYPVLEGQIPRGLATAPKLRPPKTRS